MQYLLQLKKMGFPERLRFSHLNSEDKDTKQAKEITTNLLHSGIYFNNLYEFLSLLHEKNSDDIQHGFLKEYFKYSSKDELFQEGLSNRKSYLTEDKVQHIINFLMNTMKQKYNLTFYLQKKIKPPYFLSQNI